MASKKVGVILAGYKDYVNRFLDECRDSLRAQTYPRELFNVYIIDNCSLDDCAYVKNNYPEAKCASRPDGNYAAANNLGIKMAKKDGCQYFVIANMDTKFDSRWLEELVAAIENDPCVGVAQSKIMLYPGRGEEKKNPRINSVGNITHFLGFGFTDGYGEPDRKIDGYPDIGGYASGCAFIVRKEVVEKIGGENEDLWMYHDDLDFSWRVKLAGYRIVLAPRSVMYHKYEFARSVRMLYYMERNRYLVMFYYYRWRTLFLILPAMIVMEAGMCGYAIAGGWFGTKLKVASFFLDPRNWAGIIRRRKMASAIRRKKDREIVASFSGRVLYQEIDNPVLKFIANPLLDLYWRAVKRLIFW